MARRSRATGMNAEKVCKWLEKVKTHFDVVERSVDDGARVLRVGIEEDIPVLLIGKITDLRKI